MLLLLALTQAVSASPPTRIDITIPQPCQPHSAAPDEVVVCAPGENPYRVNEPKAPPKTLPKAEAKLAEGVALGAETEAADVGGETSNRIMVRLKVKF